MKAKVQLKSRLFFIRTRSVADPGFPRGGGANSQNCYYFAIFLPKTA